jgi:glycosyltransferase involved in cell wall biosynthesis
MSVAEAMLAGCIPVVANSGALPEVVGSAGIYVDPQDQAAVCDGIRRALVATDEARQIARSRILQNFPIERRAQALLDIVGTHIRNDHP